MNISSTTWCHSRINSRIFNLTTCSTSCWRIQTRSIKFRAAILRGIKAIDLSRLVILAAAILNRSKYLTRIISWVQRLTIVNYCWLIWNVLISRPRSLLWWSVHLYRGLWRRGRKTKTKAGLVKEIKLN